MNLQTMAAKVELEEADRKHQAFVTKLFQLALTAPTVAEALDGLLEARDQIIMNLGQQMAALAEENKSRIVRV